MSQPAGKCIFCGSGGLSKEHIWASWLHELTGKTEDSHFLRRDRLQPRTGIQLIEDRKFQGSLTSRKRRCVCREHCNGGWMSGIESRAKAAMAPAILGQSISLSSEDQRAIAAWLTLKTIIEDRSNIEESSVPDSDVAQFYRSKSPLPTWRLFVGSYEGRAWNPNRLFYAYCFMDFPHGRERYQATTWVAGRLFLHAISGTGLAHHVFAFPHFLQDVVHEIHPRPDVSETLCLPRQPTITDVHAMDIADGFYRSFTGYRSITNRF